MKIKEFVIMENPKGKDLIVKTEIFSVLDGVYMDPMERELIKNKIETDHLIKGDEVSYRADLVAEYIKYHMENEQLPVLIEILGLDNIFVSRIINGFKKVISNFDFTNYEATTVGPYVNGIIGASKSYLKEKDMNVDEFVIKFGNIFGSNKEQKTGRMRFQTRVSLILEYIGYEIVEDGYVVWCMVYDRHHKLHGYVALRVHESVEE